MSNSIFNYNKIFDIDMIKFFYQHPTEMIKIPCEIICDSVTMVGIYLYNLYKYYFTSELICKICGERQCKTNCSLQGLQRFYNMYCVFYYYRSRRISNFLNCEICHQHTAFENYRIQAKVLHQPRRVLTKQYIICDIDVLKMKKYLAYKKLLNQIYFHLISKKHIPRDIGKVIIHYLDPDFQIIDWKYKLENKVYILSITTKENEYFKY